MSTTQNPNRRNRPEPVRPWFARLFLGRPADAIPQSNPTAAAPTTALAAILRQAEDLRAARAAIARWKGHADSYDRERRDALRESAHLLAWIAALHPGSAVIAPAHDGDGSQDLYLVAGGWQLSWPIPAEHADLFRHVTVVEVTDVRAQWDGHGAEQRGERVRGHVRLLALDAVADGPLTAVVAEPQGA